MPDPHRSALARGLVHAEARLRAAGLTGPAAFDVLVAGLRARRTHRPIPEVLADSLDELPLDGPVDLLGLAWERFFPDLFRGRHGQFFTPLPLVRLLLAHLDVRGRQVLDPTCGPGSFLVEAARRGADVCGIEVDPSLTELARLNLELARVRGPVTRADFFATPADPVDVVVANPPFSVDITAPEVLSAYDLGRGRRRVPSDWLFVEALGRWVRPGGQAGAVLPWSTLANRTHAPLRERLRADFAVERVLALPEGVFRPFGGAAGRAALVWLRRRPAADAPTWWAALADPGYDVRSQSLRLTSPAEVDALAAGEGWAPLPEGRWFPAAVRAHTPVSALARARTRTVRLDGSPGVGLVELADADKRTGEVPVVRDAAGTTGSKIAFATGDVLVSRLRPGLGNVALAPAHDAPLVGSTEWIPLEPAEHPHALLLCLRTPAWRAQLGSTEGQTRPRTTRDAVLAAGVRWPAPAVVARLDAAAACIHQQRSALLAELQGLQELVDAYARGELTDAELGQRLDSAAQIRLFPRD